MLGTEDPDTQTICRISSRSLCRPLSEHSRWPLTGMVKAGSTAGAMATEVLSPSSDLTSQEQQVYGLASTFMCITSTFWGDNWANCIQPNPTDAMDQHYQSKTWMRHFKTIRGSRVEYCKLHCYPNHGRNFGPLLQGLGQELDEHCDLYAHLHTKRSQHLNPIVTTQWRKFLMDHLLGQDGCPVMDSIINTWNMTRILGWSMPMIPTALAGQKIKEVHDYSWTNLDSAQKTKPRHASEDHKRGFPDWKHVLDALSFLK